MQRPIQKLGFAAIALSGALVTASCSTAPTIAEKYYSVYIGKGDNEQVVERGVVIEKEGKYGFLKPSESFPYDCSRNPFPKDISLVINTLVKEAYDYSVASIVIKGSLAPYQNLEGITFGFEVDGNPDQGITVPSFKREEFKRLLKVLFNKYAHSKRCL